MNKLWEINEDTRLNRINNDKEDLEKSVCQRLWKNNNSEKLRRKQLLQLECVVAIQWLGLLYPRIWIILSVQLDHNFFKIYLSIKPPITKTKELNIILV